MKGLPLTIYTDSLDLLSERTDLMQQMEATKIAIENISDKVDGGKFSQIKLDEDFVEKLNAKSNEINANQKEQQALSNNINTNNEQIKALRQKSTIFSIVVIAAVLIIFFMIIK